MHVRSSLVTEGVTARAHASKSFVFCKFFPSYTTWKTIRVLETRERTASSSSELELRSFGWCSSPRSGDVVVGGGPFDLVVAKLELPSFPTYSCASIAGMSDK